MVYHCYKITCQKTGKSYIGFTSQVVEARWRGHQRSARRGSDLIFHKAIRKHGADSFVVDTLASFQNRADALDCEVKMICQFGSMAPNGYNMTCGGEGCVELSADAKAAKSKNVKAAHARTDVKDRHRAGILASITKERRQKISEFHTGKKMHPNAKEAIAAAKKTQAYREIASKAASKTWKRSGYKEKWVAAKLEKHIAKADRFPCREDGLIFSSTRAAANYMKQNGWPKAAPNNIALACGGKYKSSCGYSWSWINGDTARKGGEIIT